jgi:hypothetical protein
LIDNSGKEQLLLRNPADYQGGFWLTYDVDNVVYKVSSTESSTLSLLRHESDEAGIQLVFNHSPIENEAPKIRFEIEAWSHNTPILLVRYTAVNLSKKPLRNVKLYCIMDFDIGGPSSYKDDVGIYDSDSSVMLACDNTPLCVAMTSRPKPDAWEISSPMQIRIDENSSDLSKNLKYGPKDIATALQWNLGTLDSNQESVVNIVLAASDSSEGVKALLPTAWELFEKRFQ